MASIVEREQSSEENLSLNTWDLPDEVYKCYSELGITHLFKWQQECLQIPGVLQGRNLVYSAPTSAGKTLVAELLLLKRVLEEGMKAIFIVPFVSMAREKTNYLQRVFSAGGLVVEGFMGNQAPAGGLAKVDVAVCTIEKANNLCNRLLQEGILSTVGVVVVDELHLVSDGQRGYLLELLLTKLRYTALKAVPVGRRDRGDAVPRKDYSHEHQSSADSPDPSNDFKPTTGKSSSPPLQIIGMSATLPNLSLLARWLDAALYVTSHRPVPLQHLLLCDGVLYEAGATEGVRKMDRALALKGDQDGVIQTSLEPVLEGFSSLVFCPTRARTEALAVAVARHIYAIGSEAASPHPWREGVRAALDGAALVRVLQALQRCPAGLDKTLACTLQYGTAFHHAGLTVEERDIIEASYRSGIVRVLVATSTLSSGVNLPARRVIIRSPVLAAGRMLDPLTYHQMAGRAGRMGVDTKGESVLVCSGARELAAGRQLMSATLPPITSCLARDTDSLSGAMKRAILEIIVSGAARSLQDVELYCRCTLLAASLQEEGQEEAAQPPIAACIRHLVSNEFISCGDDGILSSSQLGRAVLSSGLSPEEGLAVFRQLHSARQGLALDTDFHLVMLVTPIYLSCSPDWVSLLSVWDGLPAAIKRVARQLGVKESFIVQAVKGTVNIRQENQAQQLHLQKRFVTALALYDLLQELPLPSVAAKFNINKGLLQSLQHSAATFAGMVGVFCSCLGWRSLALLVREFEGCLELGVRHELCDLARLPHLSSKRARLLYDAGLTTLQDLANCSQHQLHALLVKSTPFASRVQGDHEAKRRGCRQKKEDGSEDGGVVWVEGSGHVSIAREAALILQDARSQLIKQLGVADIKWGNSTDGKITGALAKVEASRTSLVEPNMLVPPLVSEQDIVRDADCGVKDSVPETKNIAQKRSEDISSLVSVSNISSEDAKVISEIVVAKNCINNCKSLSGEAVFSKQDKASSLRCSGAIGYSNDKPSKNINECNSSFATTTLESPLAESLALVKCTPVRTSDASGTTSPISTPLARRRQLPGSRISCSGRTDDFVLSLHSSSPSLASTPASSATDASFLCPKTTSRSAKTPTDAGRNLELPEELDESLLAMSLSPWTCQTPLLSSFKPNIPQDSDEDDVVVSLCQSSPVVLLNGNDYERKYPTTKASCKPLGAYEAQLDLFSLENSCSDLFQESLVSSFGDMQITTGKKTHLELDLSDPNEFNDIATPQTGKFDDCKVVLQMMATSARENKENVAPSKRGTADQYSASPQLKVLDDQIVVTKSTGVNLLTLNDITHIRNETENSRKTRRSSNFSFGIDRRKADRSDKSFDLLSLSLTDELEKAVCNSKDLSGLGLDANITSNHHTEHSIENISGDDFSRYVSVHDSPQPADVGKSSNKKGANTHSLSLMGNPEATSQSPDSSSSVLLNLSDEMMFETSDASFVSSLPSHSASVPGRKLSTPSLRTTHSVVKGLVSPTVNCDEPSAKDSSSNHVHIVNVCGSSKLFETFLEELCQQQNFSLCLALRKSSTDEYDNESDFVECDDNGFPKQPPQRADGAGPSNGSDETTSPARSSVSGVAIAWAGLDAYYIDLQEAKPGEVSLSRRRQALKTMISAEPSSNTRGPSSSATGVVVWRCRQLTRALLMAGLGLLVLPPRDPLVAIWMLGEDTSRATLMNLATKWVPEMSWLCDDGLIATAEPNGASSWSSAIGAAARSAVLLPRLMARLEGELRQHNLWQHWARVEMRCAVLLARLELNGMGFSEQRCAETIQLMRSTLSSLEAAAHRSCGRVFQLASFKDQAAVLYKTLRLPPPTAWRQRLSKEALASLEPLHPLPGIILRWRKLHAACNKMLIPLQQRAMPCPGAGVPRIHPRCHTMSATGRVSMSEPSLQCMPKDVTVTVPVADEGTAKAGENKFTTPAMKQLLADAKRGSSSPRSREVLVSCRSVIVAGPHRLLLSADFCQLELRILAHCCGDPALLRLLSGQATQDAFLHIAAEVLAAGRQGTEVGPQQRDVAKQLCYAIIYGMGSKSLAAQLSISEEEAKTKQHAFLTAFPNVAAFIKDTVKEARKLGFVTTIMGRRRYLPNINSSDTGLRGQSERQAVNSVIQGSAADVVKAAMVSVERALSRRYPRQPPIIAVNTEKEGGEHKAHLVLQLHDELMYEVCSEEGRTVADVLRQQMENTTSLDVPLPVKIKIGPSWGQMQPLQDAEISG